MESFSIFPFVIALFHLAWYLPGLFMCLEAEMVIHINIIFMYTVWTHKILKYTSNSKLFIKRNGVSRMSKAIGTNDEQHLANWSIFCDTVYKL